MKFIPEATRPITITTPNFLVHQTATDKRLKPIESQRKGNPVAWKKIGEKIELSTPHNAAIIAIAAIFWLLKYTTNFPH